MPRPGAPQGHRWTSPRGLVQAGEGWSLSVRPLGGPGGRSVPGRRCAAPVVTGLLAFCNGRGWGGCTHMLPVVTGRFLFSQAPDLLLPMWKQGQLQPGWLQVGRPDPAQRGLSGPISPGPDPGQWMARVTPPPPPTAGPHPSCPQQLPPRGRGQAGLSLKAEQVVQEVRGPRVGALVSALSFAH